MYIDDLHITRSSTSLIDYVASQLSSAFDMKDLGFLKYFLGIEFVNVGLYLWLLQRKYAMDMLKRFNMLDCKPISIPLEQNIKLHASEGKLLADPLSYQ